MKTKNFTVLILGGSGFIGSNIAQRFCRCRAKYNVVIIDGLLEGACGQRANLKGIKKDVRFIECKIENVGNLKNLVKSCDIIIDCMALTPHRTGINNPIYDLRLNAESHLVLIQHLINFQGKNIIYLGSRSQYGNVDSGKIVEMTPMNPNDIQGIHKLAAESYYRIYSKLYGFNVVSLRFPNCFGKNQPVEGEDIGLIGSFIRDALNGKTVEVFGNRKRNLVYVDDVAEVVFKLANKHFVGFNAFNLSGHRVTIELLASSIISITGHGKLETVKLPERLKAIDIGDAELNDNKLKKFLGKIPKTDLQVAFRKTIEYFKRGMEL